MSNWKVIRESDDPLALRLSVGSPTGHDPKESGYIVFRGDPRDCLGLLKEAVLRLEEHLEEQGE